MRHEASAGISAAARTLPILLLALAGLALAAEPAGAITAEVAKKCREAAVKSHPPQAAGTKPYAQAEREAFRDCVAKEQKQEPER